jgi:hypothetical protein
MRAAAHSNLGVVIFPLALARSRARILAAREQTPASRRLAYLSNGLFSVTR